ncbi:MULTISPECIES: Fur family transcriptional regulator [unclassified Nocardiopsis]|uniref:Fur family transcriptional regulator n=1 Tax=unclassified Nocardiopsis TaxID=2649073 RepID=UPI00135B1976|nr:MULTISPECIES: Fur family transcriptional regulator [unclassified Nocardiopsis]
MDDATDLRAVGLRVTAARLAILSTVRSGNHLDAEHIAEGVREKVGHVSTQGVYDALHALTGAGLLRRIEPAGSPARYEVRVGDNHHHLVCRACGEVRDVDCTVGRAPCLQPSDAHGYVIDEAEVVFWGTCPRCQEEATAVSGPLGASDRAHRTAAD